MLVRERDEVSGQLCLSRGGAVRAGVRLLWQRAVCLRAGVYFLRSSGRLQGKERI